MIERSQISLFDFLSCISDAVDLVSPVVESHHKQVAYIAYSIAGELGLPPETRTQLLLAGALHDVGALSLKERLEILQFETVNSHQHSELGYLLLNAFRPLSDVATLVRFHHIPWSGGKGVEAGGREVPRGSHILHLADRVAVQVKKQQEILDQARPICDRIGEGARSRFDPLAVDAFRSLAAKEYFWLDLASKSLGSILRGMIRLETMDLDGEGLLALTDFFRKIIDFRSNFTATHSKGVAACAEGLAGQMGFSEKECRIMKVAGHLHDLGKLAVPSEILEKPARLAESEFNVVKNHAYYTFRILQNVGALGEIAALASFHHERLDGKGYPFHLKGPDLSPGSRIMAVADVFTALTEDRPYRPGLDRGRVMDFLQRMARASALDPEVLSTLELHYDETNELRVAAQSEASREYEDLFSKLP